MGDLIFGAHGRCENCEGVLSFAKLDDELEFGRNDCDEDSIAIL